MVMHYLLYKRTYALSFAAWGADCAFTPQFKDAVLYCSSNLISFVIQQFFLSGSYPWNDLQFGTEVFLVKHALDDNERKF
jgi:hypothetical protein